MRRLFKNKSTRAKLYKNKDYYYQGHYGHERSDERSGFASRGKSASGGLDALSISYVFDASNSAEVLVCARTIAGVCGVVFHGVGSQIPKREKILLVEEITSSFLYQSDWIQGHHRFIKTRFHVSFWNRDELPLSGLVRPLKGCWKGCGKTVCCGSIRGVSKNSHQPIDCKTWGFCLADEDASEYCLFHALWINVLLVEYRRLMRRAYPQLVSQVVQRSGGYLMQIVVLRQVVFRRPFRSAYITVCSC